MQDSDSSFGNNHLQLLNPLGKILRTHNKHSQYIFPHWQILHCDSKVIPYCVICDCNQQNQDAQMHCTMRINDSVYWRNNVVLNEESIRINLMNKETKGIKCLDFTLYYLMWKILFKVGWIAYTKVVRVEQSLFTSKYQAKKEFSFSNTSFG